MPAHALTITLTGPLADEVRAAAEAENLTPEEYVRQQLALDLAAGADPADDNVSWEEDYRRLAEPGENVSLDEAFDRFNAQIAEARTKAK